MNKSSLHAPKKILQFYSSERQKAFEHFTPQDRLEWLAAINLLYWQADNSRTSGLGSSSANRKSLRRAA